MLNSHDKFSFLERVTVLVSHFDFIVILLAAFRYREYIHKSTETLSEHLIDDKL